MHHKVFISALRLIAQLNELTLIFNVWIVSPVATSKAVDPAFSFFMSTVLHGFQFYWLWLMLDCVAHLRLRNARERYQEAQSGYEIALEKELDAQESHLTSTKDIDWKVLFPFVFSYIQTAAASNAALLLAAQTAELTESKSYTTHVILLAAGLFYFFLSRLADCYLARAMGLPLYFGQHRTAKVVIPQVANLPLVVLLRAGVRWSAGMKPFAGAWGNDALGVEKLVGFAGFLDCLGRAPKWLSPVLLVLSPCLMYLSGRFSAKLRVE